MKQNNYLNRVRAIKEIFTKSCKNKKISVLIFMLIITIPICKSQDNKYIYLNAKQLEPLGIELSTEGLFYQNCNPKHQKDGKFPYYSFYTFGSEQSISSRISDDCEQKNFGTDGIDTIFQNKRITKNDFYPMFVLNTAEGKYNFSSESNVEKLVPIAVNMAETKIPNRTDTVVFWFKVTESFKKAIPEEIIIEDYMRLPDEVK